MVICLCSTQDTQVPATERKDKINKSTNCNTCKSDYSFTNMYPTD